MKPKSFSQIILGLAGSIRFVVNEEELVASVTDTALKSYAREGRLPVLGSNLNDFVLYCPISGTEGKLPHRGINWIKFKSLMYFMFSLSQP